MDRLERPLVVLVGRHQTGACSKHGLTDALGTRGQLGSGCPHPDPDLSAGLVQQAVVAPHEWDPEAHGARVQR